VIRNLALRSRRRRGLAIVEIALSLLLLILILLGVLEYGWLFVRYGQLRNAARHGARIGVTLDATQGQVTSAISSLMTDAKMPTYTTSFADPGLVLAGSPYPVTVSVVTADVDLTNFSLFPKPASLSSTVTMRKEGVP
jgi:Flp pilus assembly protein TadG